MCAVVPSLSGYERRRDAVVLGQYPPKRSGLLHLRASLGQPTGAAYPVSAGAVCSGSGVWEARMTLPDAPEPDWCAVLRLVAITAVLGELACVIFLIGTWDEPRPELPFIRVGVGFFMGVIAMVWPLLWVMNEGRVIARYCLEHHCGYEQEPK
jgi:hypothetical protein